MEREKRLKFCILRTISELKLWFIFIYEPIANQNSVRYSVSISYSTNFTVKIQKVSQFRFCNLLPFTVLCSFFQKQLPISRKMPRLFFLNKFQQRKCFYLISLVKYNKYLR